MAQQPGNTHKKFIAIYDELSDALFRHCVLRISDRERAQELMQDTFTKTWEYLAKGETISNLKAFLYRTLHNLIIDEYRARPRSAHSSLEQLIEDGYEPVDHCGARTEHSAEARIAVEAIQKLGESYRDVLLFRYVDELSVQEIARIVGESENVVSVRIHRGTAQLRELLCA